MNTGYASYYKHQVGSGNIAIYKGRVSQRGHGIGGMLSGLLRGATPIFKSIGKSLLKAGMGVAHDVLSGENIKHSLSHRGRSVGKQLIKKSVRALSTNSAQRQPVTKKRRKNSRKILKQTGGGKGRPRKRKHKATKRTKTDLFGHL